MDGRPIYGFDPLPFACAGHVGDGDGFQRGGFDLSFMLVNGVAVAVSPPGTTGAQPTISLSNGELPVLLRILNASPGRPYMIALGWDFAPPSFNDPLVPVNVLLKAIDGVDLAVPVPLSDGLPLASIGPGLNITGGLLLPPGGRYDLIAVRQSRGTRYDGIGTARPTLWGNAAHCALGTPACPGLSPFPIASFAVVSDGVNGPEEVTGCNASTRANASSGNTSSPCVPILSPEPLPSLDLIADDEVPIRRRFVLSEQREQPIPAHGDDGSVNREIDPLSLIASGMYINNRTFDPDRVDVPDILLGSAGVLCLSRPGRSDSCVARFTLTPLSLQKNGGLTTRLPRVVIRGTFTRGTLRLSLCVLSRSQLP